MLLAMLMFLCSCSISGKRELIGFAVNHYGDCKLLREEHKGSGNDEYRTVYLQDKETGVEYKVTSSFQNINVDGSSFGYVNDISSNFEVEYVDYLSSEADKKISSLERDYGCYFVFSVDSIDIYFDNRVEIDTAFDAAESCDDILADIDVKEMRPVLYNLYADKAYLGCYEADSKTANASNTYNVIDYVHENYDPDAEYLDSLGAFASEFLTHEEVDKLFPGHDGTPGGTAYYFKDSDGDIFVAIDLKDFGADKNEIRLYRDTSRGMEEIVI
jgi:hypothetical protein